MNILVPELEKLRREYLPEANFKYEFCNLACGSHCEDTLGCTKWRKYKGSKERVSDFKIVLRENYDKDTLAHEFTHAFLTFHYDFSDHHGKGDINQSKNAHFWSFKEWFLNKLDS